MHSEPSFIGDLAVVLLVASAASMLLRWARLPPLLGYLVAGLLVGPYIPVPVFADPKRIEALAEFGVVLVMFSVGLEFSIRRLLQLLPRAGVTAVVQMSVMMWAGFALGRALGWSLVEGVFLGSCLAISSTMVVARVFSGADVPRSQYELVFGVLVVQDVVAVGLIAMLTAIASGSQVSPTEMADVVLRLVMVLGAMVAVGMLVIPRLVRTIVKVGTPEVVVVTMTGMCFGMAMLAHSLGYSVALGAFLAGILANESGKGHRVEHIVSPLRDLFAATFFVSIGMMVDPRLAWAHGDVALLVAAIVIVGQFVSVSSAGTLSGNGLGTSVRAALSLGQIGEFSFIMVGIGTAAGVIQPALLPIVVTVAAITAFTTPLMVRISGRIASIVDHRLPPRLQQTLSLYESWFERLNSPAHRQVRRSRNRRLGAALFLDGAFIAGIVIAASIWKNELIAWLIERGVPEEFAALALVGAAFAATIPFLLGMLRSAKVSAQRLANTMLPQKAGQDLADAPRRLLTVSLQLVAVIAVGAPVVVLTQPFLPPFYGAAVFTGLVVILGFYFWRDARNLQGHVRAGAEVIAEMLARQGYSADTLQGTGPQEIEKLLPGMGTIVSIRVPPGAFADGKSLSELDLRAQTGATALAVCREQDQNLFNPTGHVKLRKEDVVALAGSTESIEHARRLLTEGPSRKDEHAAQ